jgi:hypothetical protein
MLTRLFRPQILRGCPSSLMQSDFDKSGKLDEDTHNVYILRMIECFFDATKWAFFVVDCITVVLLKKFHHIIYFGK